MQARVPLNAADARAHCAAEVRRHDYDRYLCALFAPRQAQPALLALCAFNLELARIPETVREPALADLRRLWWHEAIDALAGRVDDHPVLVALSGADRRHQLDKAKLAQMIDARDADHREMPPATLDDLEAYARGTSGSLMRLWVNVLESPDTGMAGAAEAAGTAFALTGLMRAVPFHAADRRIYLPADLLDNAGIPAADLFEGRAHAGLGRAVAPVLDRARTLLAETSAGAKAAPRRVRPALLPAVLGALYLRRLDAAGNDPFSPALAVSPLKRQFSLARACWTGRL